MRRAPGRGTWAGSHTEEEMSEVMVKEMHALEEMEEELTEIDALPFANSVNPDLGRSQVQ